jgi:hypothetical protein
LYASKGNVDVFPGGLQAGITERKSSTTEILFIYVKRFGERYLKAPKIDEWMS